jgi:putative Holliday junction resolvase
MKKRIGSIDYGLARIGLALSDERQMIATSLTTLKAEKTKELTVQSIVDTFAPFSLECLVIGLPLLMNGKEGTIAEEVKQMIALLQARVSYPIIAWDERLTTAQAEKALKESNMNRKKRAKVIDAVTAMIILQNFLDSRYFQQQALKELPP